MTDEQSIGVSRRSLLRTTGAALATGVAASTPVIAASTDEQDSSDQQSDAQKSDDGEVTIKAHLPLDEVAIRINRRLDTPFYASIEDNTLRIKDIRDELDYDEHPPANTDRSQRKMVKEVIETLEPIHEDGARIRKVIVYLRQAGVTSPEEILNQLRSQGDVYEPKAGYLRIV
jgi:rhodanese-related sulfurtransferase